ncbi:GNAT family N-acetyltransferase [Arcobacter sp.]|uniref:GNAT family N-acetyltransferase n=1 Tax=Arcobacter sp. TaxID=1872629 RepID=UPI003D0D0C5C
MITIRNYKNIDLNILYQIRNDETLQKNLMSLPKKESYDDVVKWIQIKQSKDIFKIISIEESDQCIGYIQIVDINNSLFGKLGIAIHKKYQNFGYGQKALKIFFNNLKEKTNLKKILLEVLSTNKNAIKVYEKLGFKQINILKNHFLLNEKLIDVIVMEKKLNEKK